jgi:hypothetical protein
MLIYCKNCQNLIDRIDDANFKEGEIIEVECKRCGENMSVYIKYKPIVNLYNNNKDDKIS